MVHRTRGSRAHFQAHNEKPAQEPSGGGTQVRAIFHLVDLAIGVKAIVTKTPCSVTIGFLKWFTERVARGRTFKHTTKNPLRKPSGGGTQVRAIFHLVDLAIDVKAIVTKMPCSVTIDFLKWFTEREARGRTFKRTTKNRSGVTVTRNCYYNAVLIS